MHIVQNAGCIYNALRILKLIIKTDAVMLDGYVCSKILFVQNHL